jgi:hypothetical protein
MESLQGKDKLLICKKEMSLPGVFIALNEICFGR